jgi:anti-sigma factor RsiW
VTGESHRVLREQVGAYALGQLSGERWREVDVHLQVCAACRADLEEVAPVAGLLGTARDRLALEELGEAAGEDDPPPLSPALLEEVRAAARDADAASAPEGRPSRWRGRGAAAAGRGRRWVPVAAAVGLLAAGGIGFAVGSVVDRSPAGPLETVAVRALDPQVQAAASVVPHTWGMEVKLVATGFDQGASYRVSVTDDGGRVVSAGEFIGTGSQEMRCNLNSSVLRADAASFQVAGPDGAVVLDAAV